MFQEVTMNATDLREKFGREAAFGDNRVSGKNAKCKVKMRTD